MRKARFFNCLRDSRLPRASATPDTRLTLHFAHSREVLDAQLQRPSPHTRVRSRGASICNQLLIKGLRWRRPANSPGPQS